jgi:hypothetical protein
MSFDFADWDTTELSEAGVWIQINHPKTGEPTDVAFKIASGNSKKVRRVRAEQEKRRAKMRQQTTENQHEELVEAAAAGVIDWRNVDYKGQPLTCNDENKKMILRGSAKTLTQVIQAMADDESFFPQTAKPSENGSAGISE